MQTGAIFGLTSDNIVTCILVIFRIAGLFAIAPIYGHRMVPVRVRLFLSLMIGYFLFRFVGAPAIDLTAGLLPLMMLALREFLFGILLGFLFQIIFIGVQFGGGVIGYQIGFAIVNVIDPSTSTNISIISQTKLLMAILIFLVINGHHVILQALYESYRLVPLGAVSLKSASIEGIIQFTGRTFIVGIKLASPVIVTLFCTDVCLGIVARTMPQMNVFIVGFPLKIGVGLFILGTTFPLFYYVFTKMLGSMNSEIMQITKGLTG